MFGQLYSSDLWVLEEIIVYPRYMFIEDCQDGLNLCVSLTVICMTIVISVALIPFVIGYALPSIIDNFALPFTFFFAILGINIDENKYERDGENYGKCCFLSRETILRIGYRVF